MLSLGKTNWSGGEIDLSTLFFCIFSKMASRTKSAESAKKNKTEMVENRRYCPKKDLPWRKSVWFALNWLSGFFFQSPSLLQSTESWRREKHLFSMRPHSTRPQHVSLSSALNTRQRYVHSSLVFAYLIIHETISRTSRRFRWQGNKHGGSGCFRPTLRLGSGIHAVKKGAGGWGEPGASRPREW